jgi:DNA-directed RNA polymerase subunit RPC12/RpoP
MIHDFIILIVSLLMVAGSSYTTLTLIERVHRPLDKIAGVNVNELSLTDPRFYVGLTLVIFQTGTYVGITVVVSSVVWGILGTGTDGEGFAAVGSGMTMYLGVWLVQQIRVGEEQVQNADTSRTDATQDISAGDHSHTAEYQCANCESAFGTTEHTRGNLCPDCGDGYLCMSGTEVSLNNAR